jgi:hypothetical protein
MKRVVFVIGVVLLLSGIFAGSAAAQTNSDNLSLFLPATTPSADAASLAIAPLPFTSATNASATAPIAFAVAPMNTASSSAFSQPLESPQQDVQGVFQNFNWQAYAGYTFVRFFQVPGIQLNTNGLNFGVVYYFKDWIGADGEFVGTFASQYGDTAKFLLGMGGGRLRWSAPRGLELWAHALVGGSHYLPRTANGDTGALAYEFGGGVDINAGRRRWAYRLSADVVGTRFFNTYQYSPKFSAGIVFKF